MAERDETYERANAEANEVFGKLLDAVQELAKQGDEQISVLDATRRAGLEIDNRVLAELQIPELVPIQRFLPAYVWFPWRPIWCWWWRFRYPWYRCCPYWWYRCHWYTH